MESSMKSFQVIHRLFDISDSEKKGLALKFQVIICNGL